MSKYSNDDMQEIDQIADALKALSNPHRLRVFLELADCCKPGTQCSVDSEQSPGLCVGDLAKGVDVAPSTLSHHLKELNRAGLLSMQRKGQRVECCVVPDAIQRLIGFFTKCC